ncbi:hypothetical protein D3C85_1606460 [compost metagenome]
MDHKPQYGRNRLHFFLLPIVSRNSDCAFRKISIDDDKLLRYENDSTLLPDFDLPLIPIRFYSAKIHLPSTGTIAPENS